MPNFQVLAIITLCISAVSLILCLIQHFRLRRELHRVAELRASIAELEAQLMALQRETESATRALAAQRATPDDAGSKEVASGHATVKLGLTERRYRVLRLARRGLDARAISSMLDIPHGEVELIIGLSRAA